MALMMSMIGLKFIRRQSRTDESWIRICSTCSLMSNCNGVSITILIWKKITLVLWEQTFSVVLLFTLHYNNADILVHKNFLFSNHMKTGFCSLFSQIQKRIIFSAIIFHYYYYFIDKNVPTLPAKMKWVLTFISKKVHSTQWLEANDLTILSQGFVNLQINYCVEHKWW